MGELPHETGIHIVHQHVHALPAIINPLEALPVFLKLLDGKDLNEHRAVARQSCVYAVLLMLFFLLFGTLILRLFGVPLSMVRIVGGIILMRIGFQLLSASSDNGSIIPAAGSGQDGKIAFVPLALPLMCGPEAIATILGMTTLIKHWRPSSNPSSPSRSLSWPRCSSPICAWPTPGN